MVGDSFHQANMFYNIKEKKISGYKPKLHPNRNISFRQVYVAISFQGLKYFKIPNPELSA